jgi:hypothetical protein
MALHNPSGHTVEGIVGFGASGTGVQVSFDVAVQVGDRVPFLCYVDDELAGVPLASDDRPVLTLDEAARRFPGAGVFVSVHSPAGRRRIFDRLTARGIPIVGADGSAQLRHPSADLGEGVIVASTTRVGPLARLGRGVIALADLVAHDVVVGEFSTLAVGSTVLGHVRIGREVWVGAGAVVGNGTAERPVVIGDGAVIGAGAVVRGDVQAGAVLVGPPAATPSGWSALRRFLRERRGQAGADPDSAP